MTQVQSKHSGQSFKKKRRPRLSKGYNLHDRRIAYSGGTGSMRTIKYELKDPHSVNGLRDSIADAIVSDNKWLYGNINLNDYLDWRAGVSDEDVNRGVREYSFLGFWIKALSLGFVFSNKIELEFKQYLGVKSEQEQLFDLIPDELRNILDRDKWVKWFTNSVRPKSGTNVSLKKKILDLFLKEHKESSVASDKSERFCVACNSGIQNDIAFRKELFEIRVTDNEPAQNDTFSGSLYFSCDPNFSISTFSINWTEQLDQIIDFWLGKLDETTAKKFLGIGENGNHFNNGLFGAFLETMQGDDSVLNQFAQRLEAIFGFDAVKTQIIYARAKELREYAKQLPVKPQVIQRWSDYRSDFNGTIESWYSNRERNRNDSLKQFFGELETNEETGETKIETAGINVFLEKIKDSLPHDCDIREGILRETIDHIASLDNDPRKLNKGFTDQLNDYYLPTLRDDLNAWSQQDQPNQESLDSTQRAKNSELLPKSWFKVLKKNVQKMPLFFGESKRLQWEQIYSLKTLITVETDKLDAVLGEQFVDSEITDKQIDMLASLFNRIKDDGSKRIIDRLRNIETELGLTFADKNEKSKYYLSGFERARYKQLHIPKHIKISRLLELASLEELYQLLRVAPQENYILRDTVQLSKIVVSAKLMNLARDKQRDAVLAHSNLQGYSSIISKQQFISRYSIQATNGGQCLLATAIGKTSTRGKKGKTKTSEHKERYFYAFPGALDAEPEDRKFELSKIIKTNAHSPEDFDNFDKARIKPKYSALQVFSSKYQVQFLDWFFGLHKNKETSLAVNGAFSIAEKTVDLSWNGENPEVSLNAGSRVFVSQPFTIVTLDNKKDHPGIENQFIGVDIGEYGLAWSLIQAQGNRVLELESDFLDDNQQQVLKSEVKSWRQNQVRQTFTSMDTKVARLRESLIGSYKNQLEALSLDKKATLSFEYEVSGFECGGNKVAKIYDSIKRSVVQKKENNPQNNQSWGKKGKYHWARETTAAGTSQYCTKCKRWSSLAIRENEEYVLSDYDHGLFKITLTNGEARLLGKQGWKAGDKIKGQDLKGAIYKSMRPNMGYENDNLDKPEPSHGLQIVKDTVDANTWQYIEEHFGRSGAGKNDPKRKYGNSAIFICPYTNCHHIAHADKQAAFNIAVRGFIKDRELKLNEKQAKKTGYFNREFLIEKQSELEFEPIGLL